MADNAFVKIGTALLKHQVKKLVGDETLEVISEELADIGGDKLDAWLGERSTQDELEKAAHSAQTCFREKVTDNELQQWMVSLPLGNLPKVVEAIDELPSSPNESKLENALRESIALTWKKLSPEQVDNAVNSFLSCLRSALLPIEKQTLMVIGRSVLRTEDKVDLLVRWFEQYIITGRSVEIKQFSPQPVESWNLKHPYAMPPNFTGRVEERKMLADWLNNDNENRLFILRALGGFGKSALSWHWLTHDVDSNDWKKVLWWSFYEGDASFERFIEETLHYLNIEVPQGGRAQIDEILNTIRTQKILFVMDGFERALRAYNNMDAAYQGDESSDVEERQLDCVNTNAELFFINICSLPRMKSKVLMTTRLTPRIVKPRGEFMHGCYEKELTSMNPVDAVEFFHKQKIKGTHAEIEAACAPYGYHPLSLRLLAGRILKDFENPADIIVAQKLKIDGDIIQQKHHVLEVSYNNLPQHEQNLLSTIACFRSPVELKTLHSIAESKESLHTDLHSLIERGLLHFDNKNKKFDLHPIVRRYTYELLTTHDRTSVHSHLSNYFAAIDVEILPQSLNDLLPIIELFHHTVQAGELSKAIELYENRLIILYYHFGAFELIIELLNALINKDVNDLPDQKNNVAQSWIFGQLASTYSATGKPRDAIALHEKTIKLSQKLRDVEYEAMGLRGAALAEIQTGGFSIAEANLRRSITLFRKTKKEHDVYIAEYEEAVCHQEFGRLLSYCGQWNDAKQELRIAHNVFAKTEQIQGESSISTYHALRALLMTRDFSQNRNNNAEFAFEFSKSAIDFAEQTPNRYFPHERDYIRALWLLGATYRSTKQLMVAESNLFDALNRCRAINDIVDEADILLDLARLRYDQEKYEEAKSLTDEALLITERCGYVLQGADVNLFLAQYALEQEKDKTKAKVYAEEALKLATCDGPPYYYKVAHEEAERMLERLKSEG